MRVIDNVYLVPGVTANTYIIAGPEGLTMIDTGLPHSEKAILRYMARKGWSVGEIKRILITHADLDHYGCLRAMQMASGACTYASPLEAIAIAEGRSSRPIDRRGANALQRLSIALFSRVMKPAPFRVDEVLAEGLVMPVLGGLQVVETPGHSPNHVSFFAPSVAVLFCGDSMRADDKGLHVSSSRNDSDQKQANASVKKQARLGARLVCPGHGPAVRDASDKFPV